MTFAAPVCGFWASECHDIYKTYKSSRRAWLSTYTAAGVPGTLRHDFRRTALRNLERAGISRSAAMKMAGHKTQAI